MRKARPRFGFRLGIPSAWVNMLSGMSSKRIDGVLFIVPSNDHEPRHVHVVMAECRLIIDLGPNGFAALATRKGAKKPQDAKESDVRKAVQLASQNHKTLWDLWEKVHAKKT